MKLFTPSWAPSSGQYKLFCSGMWRKVKQACYFGYDSKIWGSGSACGSGVLSVSQLISSTSP